MGKKLPIWVTTGQGLAAAGRFVARYPYLSGLLVGMEFVSEEASNFIPSEEIFSLRSFMWSLALSVVVSGLSAPILIAAHRFVLANDGGARYDFRPPRTRLFLLAYAGWALLFNISVLALLLPAIAQDGSAWWWVVGTLSCIVIIGLAVRLFLVFPLIAINQPSPLLRSFVMTKGRWWRICTINFIIPILALTVGSTLTKFAAPPSPAIAGHVVGLFSAVIEAFAYLAGACVLSFTFLWIVNRNATDAGRPESEQGEFA